MAAHQHTILMIGNPNVGKSALFNRLTGANAVVSNYPGTTVDVTRGVLRKDRLEYEIIDVPGAYSLEARDAAEEVAIRILDGHPDAVVMVVLDATRVERGLYLALEVMEHGNPLFVALNMIDAAREREISVDAGILQEILGVPVVPTSAVRGEGMLDLVEAVHRAEPPDIAAIEARAFGGLQTTPGEGKPALAGAAGGVIE
jgi:small GTP-binding protein